MSVGSIKGNEEDLVKGYWDGDGALVIIAKASEELAYQSFRLGRCKGHGEDIINSMHQARRDMLQAFREIMEEQ